MSENLEQRERTTFSHKLGKTATETHRKWLTEMKPFPPVFVWFKRFKEGRTIVESDERGRTSSFNEPQ